MLLWRSCRLTAVRQYLQWSRSW